MTWARSLAPAADGRAGVQLPATATCRGGSAGQVGAGSGGGHAGPTARAARTRSRSERVTRRSGGIGGATSGPSSSARRHRAAPRAVQAMIASTRASGVGGGRSGVGSAIHASARIRRAEAAGRSNSGWSGPRARETATSVLTSRGLVGSSCGRSWWVYSAGSSGPRTSGPVDPVHDGSAGPVDPVHTSAAGLCSGSCGPGTRFAGSSCSVSTGPCTGTSWSSVRRPLDLLRRLVSFSLSAAARSSSGLSTTRRSSRSSGKVSRYSSLPPHRRAPARTRRVRPSSISFALTVLASFRSTSQSTASVASPGKMRVPSGSA